MRNLDRNLNHTGSIDIKTERLLLRKVTLNDFEEFYNKLATDENIINFLSWNANPTRESVQKMVNEIIENYNNRISYTWLIEKLDTKEIIGIILVDTYNEERLVAELDYGIAEKFRGNNYATEALKAVIEYLILNVGFYRVEAVHNMDNPASGKVMQKAGMKYEGLLRGRAISLNEQGNPDDMKMYAIIKTDLE